MNLSIFIKTKAIIWKFECYILSLGDTTKGKKMEKVR